MQRGKNENNKFRLVDNYALCTRLQNDVESEFCLTEAKALLF